MTGHRPRQPGSDGQARARLHDPPGGPPRTTATLVASLRDRLAALRAMSGAAAVGSLIAGYAAAGRDAARTAEGGRLAAALRAGRPGANGQAVWSALGIEAMAQVPPSPVLDHLRNDLALLMAGDLDAALRDPHRPERPQRVADEGADEGPVDDVDYLVGMWVFSQELVAAVEALAAASGQPSGAVKEGAPQQPPEGPLLR